MTSITAYLVRHGETQFNVERITQGHSDSPLTEEGINQAKMLGERLRDVNFDVVFSSDSPRAVRTAELIIANPDVHVSTTELLRERKYGKFEGKPSKLFMEANKELIEIEQAATREVRWSIKFADDIESDEEINNRLVTFLKAVAKTHEGKTVLAVTHGGIMRAFLNYLNWNEEYIRGGSVLNTAYIKVVSDGENFNIEKVEGVKV